MKQHNRVYAEIDLDAVLYNMEQMKQRVEQDALLMAVIKTDGYGHGALAVARMFEKVSCVWGYAVASMEEAMSLREGNIEKPVLVLGCVFPDQYEEMIRYDIRPAVYTEEMAKRISEEAARQRKETYIHIKLDTGMGRIGFSVSKESAETIERICKLPYIRPEAVFTHFARADESDRSYTLSQHERFMWMKEQLEREGVCVPYYDCNNSAGIISFPEMRHNLVRAGISLYGLYPSEEVNSENVILRPALSLISHVIFVKDVEPGTAISYGGTFVAQKKMKIATIPVGYGDGYPRSLSNRGSVLIHGKRAKIVGRVCMDQFMVDVTEIPETKFMDRVVLIGSDGSETITVEELSALSGRFNYEFVCCLGKRIPRVYRTSEKEKG